MADPRSSSHWHFISPSPLESDASPQGGASIVGRLRVPSFFPDFQMMNGKSTDCSLWSNF